MGTGLVARILGAGLLLVAFAPARADESFRNEFYQTLGGAGAAAATASQGPTALLVTGMIVPGSYEEFHAALMRASPELVVLDGPGGVLGEALLIGQEIRRRHLTTVVGPHRSCASACAVVFLSGRTKLLGSGASVGLHSASYADGRADPEATAVMADYLRAVGVPRATLKRMAQTAPSEIRWLTRAEQKAMGIRAFKQR